MLRASWSWRFMRRMARRVLAVSRLSRDWWRTRLVWAWIWFRRVMRWASWRSVAARAAWAWAGWRWLARWRWRDERATLWSAAMRVRGWLLVMAVSMVRRSGGGEMVQGGGMGWCSWVGFWGVGGGRGGVGGGGGLGE